MTAVLGFFLGALTAGILGVAVGVVIGWRAREAVAVKRVVAATAAERERCALVAERCWAPDVAEAIRGPWVGDAPRVGL